MPADGNGAAMKGLRQVPLAARGLIQRRRVQHTTLAELSEGCTSWYDSEVTERSDDAARPRRRGYRMKRREFITLLGGAAAWPLAARAQRRERTQRIGVLLNLAADDPESQRRMTAFVQGLQQLVWTDGRNVQIDTRSGAADPDRIRKYAAELVALEPDVILAATALVAGAVRRATRTVPIVFVQVIDPVGAGFVESLARPGGNATGFMQYEYGLSGKWLELLKEIAPHVTRAAVIREPTDPAQIGQFAAIQSMAPSLGMLVSPVNVHDVPEIERAVTAFAHSSNGG